MHYSNKFPSWRSLVARVHENNVVMLLSCRSLLTMAFAVAPFFSLALLRYLAVRCTFNRWRNYVFIYNEELPGSLVQPPRRDAVRVARGSYSVFAKVKPNIPA